MIISRTPLRISLAGGGSDLPAYYKGAIGAVVSTAIAKYIYINVNRKFDNKVRASYSVTEIVDSADELKHELIREALKLVGIKSGVEITSISDIPSTGTGLGSSSTYTVGLLNALYAHNGQHVGPERLAREASLIELDLCGKPIGKQDQYAAAYGGLEYIQFNPDGSVFVDPIILEAATKQRLNERLLLLYTGLTRSADTILKEQSQKTESEESSRVILTKMKQQADDMRITLQENRLDHFGEILDEGWRLKKALASGISTGKINDWYETARAHGAVGGKILGAGGGGFLLLYVPPERQAEVVASLPELLPTPFQFEPQGSKIIFVEESA